MSTSLHDFFDQLAPDRDYWMKKNAWYYDELLRLHRWLIPPSRSILEIGCGTGDLLAGVSAKEKEGVDFSFEMVKIAQRKYPNVRFQVMDAQRLEFNRTFDYVILSNLVGYVDDIWQVFRELRKVCHADTRIIITNYNYLWQPLFSLAQSTGQKMPDRIQNWLPQRFLEHFLMLGGFEVVKKGKYLHVPTTVPGAQAVNDVLANTPLLRQTGLIEWCVARPVFFREKEPVSVPVSIIIPTHEEAGNIQTIVQTMPDLGKNTEVLFVDLPGQDDTAKTIRDTLKQYDGPVTFRYIEQKEKTGKIGALRLGVRKAKGDMILIYDADCTVPAADLEKCYLALVEKKAEFVNGTRMVYPTEKGAMRFFNHIGNWVFAVLFTWALDQHLTDTLCGTKGFWRKDFLDFEKHAASYDRLDRFGDLYLLCSAYRKNLKIAEVPVRYKTRRYGDTKMQRFSNGWLFFRQFLFFLWEYKIRRKM